LTPEEVTEFAPALMTVCSVLKFTLLSAKNYMYVEHDS